MSKLNLSYRRAVGSDVAYIKATWMRGYRNGEGAKSIPNTFYYQYEDAILTHIIPRCSEAGGVLVAYETLPDGATTEEVLAAPIISYIVAEPLKQGLLVHMLYVRGHDRKGNGQGSTYRQKGVAKAMLAEVDRRFDTQGDPKFYTYRTESCWKDPQTDHTARPTHGFRDYLRRIDAAYVPYLRFSLLPQGWECGGSR